MHIAIIADWLVTYGGAEHTIAAFREIWPESALFTTVTHKESLGPLSKSNIRPTWLQKIYSAIGHHQILLPLMPGALETLDLDAFDVILSSSHAVAKGIVPPPHAVHICYCHTPMRYAWEMEEEYLRDFRIPRFLQRVIRAQLRRLRRWDISTSKRVDIFIANSTETQRRIREIYGRESVVIPPPVDDRFFATPLVPAHKRRAYLAVGRLVPYKKFDLLIETANKLRLPLMIAGKGQEEQRLRSLAGPTIQFLGYIADNDLPHVYAHAKAFLFPPYEDAGIVPLEAQACGTPVIALGKGGALDTVLEEKTGLFFKDQNTDSLCEALQKFETLSFDPEYIRKHAEKFSLEIFKEKMKETVEKTLEKNINS